MQSHFSGRSGRGNGRVDVDVVVCSYEICMIEKAVLRRIPFEYIIVDEAHRLKNRASKLSRILRTEFSSNHRLLITGTPLQNNLRELWALLNFLLPQLFREEEHFEAMFDFGHSEDEQTAIFDQLRVLLTPFLLRRLKKNVVKDLPPKTELILFVGMTELQNDIYKKLLLKEYDTISTVDTVNASNDGTVAVRSPSKPEPKKKVFCTLSLHLTLAMTITTRIHMVSLNRPFCGGSGTLYLLI